MTNFRIKPLTGTTILLLCNLSVGYFQWDIDRHITKHLLRCDAEHVADFDEIVSAVLLAVFYSCDRVLMHPCLFGELAA